MTLKEYCPACQKTVEYEFSDGEHFCSICGRNKIMAEKKVKHDKQRAIAKRTKFLFKTIGIILFLLVILWGWAIEPDRMSGALLRGLGYVGILTLILFGKGIFYGIKVLIKRLKNDV